MKPIKGLMKPVTAGVFASVIITGCVNAQPPAAATRIAMEPKPAAVQAPDYSKDGFYTEIDKKDGRLWVFKADSEDLAKFKAEGKPVRQAIRPGAGPGGITLKSTEMDTIVDYAVARKGFTTEIDKKDGRLWVFVNDSEDLAKFKAEGKPARQVLRPGVGPLGLTLKSTEASTLDAYQAAL